MMKTVLINQPGEVAVIEKEAPVPHESELLIKLNALGLCGSDLKSYLGDNPMVTFPCIPGHEISGEIVRKGEGVPAGYEAGDTVTVFPYTSCGGCVPCRNKRFNCCKSNKTMGVQRDGAASGLITVPYRDVIKVEGVSPEETALIEPLSVGFHAVSRANPKPGSRVMVFGCGLIGLGAVLGACALGADVIAVDIDDAKLKLAESFGAAEVLNFNNKNFIEDVYRITEGDGPEAVIEGVGIPSTYKAAVDLVSYAGTVVYIGYVSRPVEYETKLFVSKELNILGSRNALRDDFDRVIKLIKSRKFDLSPLISRKFRLEEAADAFAYWSSNRKEVLKVMLTFND